MCQTMILWRTILQPCFKVLRGGRRCQEACQIVRLVDTGMAQEISDMDRTWKFDEKGQTLRFTFRRRIHPPRVCLAVDAVIRTIQCPPALMSQCFAIFFHSVSESNSTSLMSQMFSELGQPSRPRNQGEPSSTDMPPLNPIQMLLQTFLGPPGGIAGDAVYSQEAFDRVMSQLMELNQTGTAPGPASAEAIAALPTKKVDKSMLDDQGKAECSICMDEVKLNDQVSRLPCNHWFHPDCIKAWLNEHDTCPHCREGIMPKNDGSSRRPSVSVRSPDQPPLHSQNPWSPGHRGSGAQEYPWHADSPRSSRRPPSESRRNSSGRSSAHSRRSVSGPDGGGGSGLTDRMRNIFGGSSSRH